MKLILSALLLSSLAQADTICGNDSRVEFKDIRIGRLSFKNAPACTITMIGKSCALSAGHCTPFLKDGIVEFNTPRSEAGNIRNSDPKNTYKVDPSSISSQDQGYGRDWAVFKLLPNSITKALAGEVNGTYKISNSPVSDGMTIQIAGYGLVKDDFMGLNGTLQVAYGEITEINEYQHEDGSLVNIINHNVDTESGGSGSVIINIKDKSIIGIHTHGSLHCSVDDNKGTILKESKKLQLAIKNCLAP